MTWLDKASTFFVRGLFGTSNPEPGTRNRIQSHPAVQTLLAHERHDGKPPAEVLASKTPKTPKTPKTRKTSKNWELPGTWTLLDCDFPLTGGLLQTRSVVDPSTTTGGESSS